MCPNKLHKDFLKQGARKRCRKMGWDGIGREEEVGRVGGRNNFLTGMLTYDFSLCLIQCAISRCIIYFCVESLTAVICHYDDDDIGDGASFSRHKDVINAQYGFYSPPVLMCPSRGKTTPLTFLRSFITSQLQ